MKKLLSLIAPLLLAGCMSFSQTPPTLYALHAAPAMQRGGAAILVEEPSLPAGFDSNRIALYLYNGRRLDYYAHAAWADRLGKVLQSFIAQSIPSAVTADTGLSAPYRLHVTVLDFEPVYDAEASNAPRLKVSLAFRLISAESNHVLWNATFSAEERAAENRQMAVVAAMESMLRKVVRQAQARIGRMG